MTRVEMLDKMVDWMDHVNDYWGQDYGYVCIQRDHPEWFDEETGEPLEEYDNHIFFELDWEPYIREEAEERFDMGYRLVPTGTDCIAGIFVDWCAEWTLKQVV